MSAAETGEAASVMTVAMLVRRHRAFMIYPPFCGLPGAAEELYPGKGQTAVASLQHVEGIAQGVPPSANNSTRGLTVLSAHGLEISTEIS
jgi:hypothetical protein